MVVVVGEPKEDDSKKVGLKLYFIHTVRQLTFFLWPFSTNAAEHVFKSFSAKKKTVKNSSIHFRCVFKFEEVATNKEIYSYCRYFLLSDSI